jgi:ribonuclease E
MFSPVVQLRSGGYIVLNQAEALVAIDVNSGRATREHHIEDTALKTNLEASDEIARQLRLRDLAGLIVIDFIDMDEKRNNRSVERRLKECLKQDRARIQVGRISHFGLLEMSRQRIRTSVLESSTEKCPYCGGSGHVRSVSSLALQVLRALEEQMMKGATHNLIARTRPDVALYVLNQKRAHLRALEERFAITITVSADPTIAAPQAFAIDRGELVHTPEAARAIAEQNEARTAPLEEDDDLEDAAVLESDEDEGEIEATAPEISAEQPENGGPRRRRRRRRGRNGGAAHPQAGHHDETADATGEAANDENGELSADDLAEEESEAGVVARNDQQRDGERRRRRRGRRGGRRNRPERTGEDASPAREHGVYEPHDRPPSPEEITGAPPTGAELREAVADLDTTLPLPAPATSSTPAIAEAPHAPAPVQQPEPPRKRSTVREPAPTAITVDAAQPTPAQPASPPPQPVITEVGDSENTDKPRRSGWWSRRFAGG